MSAVFREFLKKIGSGVHTGKDLTRKEAAMAARMMLQGEATPAQIGAFLIAHRIKRPTGAELAGMLDAYQELGPKLSPLGDDRPVLVMGCPYDGRSRTAPLAPLTALVLAAAGAAVILHGGDRMPTKVGIPLVEVWQHLGVDWTDLSLEQVQQVLAATNVGFVYLPRHFPLAQGLVPYREQIGKRPPLATVELMWCPYAGGAIVCSGFVHPPTENIMREAWHLLGYPRAIAVKGLEGSCDLPRERTNIIGIYRNPQFSRLHLDPHDYGVAAANVPLDNHFPETMQAIIAKQSPALLLSLIWNSGFYLWQVNICPDVKSGMTKAETLIRSGAVAERLTKLQKYVRGSP